MSGRSNYNGYRDFDPAVGRYVESDPSGLWGGINTYAYAGASPLLFSDFLGLRDWNEQETLQLLQQAYASATAGRVQGLVNIRNNSQGNGPYDFGWNANTANDTWSRCGMKMNADEFANYVAGFQGAAYDQEFWWTTGFIWAEATVKATGILYHVAGLSKAKNDPFDRTGFPKINQGEEDGASFGKKSSCGCGQ